MIVSIGKEICLQNVYDGDDRVRSKVYDQLKKFLSSFPKGSLRCIGKYKNGISMDFCDICAEMNSLKEVVVPYEDNDHCWPDPVKKKFKEIIKKSDSIKLVSTGAFNPKKIKDMDAYILKKIDYIIDIEIINSEPLIKIKKNES